MKKISIILCLIFAIGIFSQSCEKEKNIKPAETISNLEQTSLDKAATPQQILAFIATMGVKLEAGHRYTVTYRSGCAYKRDINVLWGAFSYNELDCKSGCPICELIKIKEVGGNVIFGGKAQDNLFCMNPDGKIGLNVETWDTPDFFDGAIVCFEEGTISKKRVLCFMVDVTKTKYFEYLYDTNTFVVEHPFAIDPQFAFEMGVVPENQFIPKGEYKLYSYDDVKFWYIELDQWIKQ